MKPLHDYFYRFPHEHLRVSGRCRVRIYKRNNGTHTVLLTELNTNSGESIASACDRIATALVATRGLNLKTTRWIQHDPAHDDLPQVFDEVKFTWDSNNMASDPQWWRLGDEQAEALIGDSLSALSRRLGDLEFQTEGGTEDAGNETEGAA
ncbi:MAG: hypothetical protein H3C34_11185 [Caldilineaceae bacterium]|nr:hypothetical protein [Caldilineaceae bacterium]